MSLHDIIHHTQNTIASSADSYQCGYVSNNCLHCTCTVLYLMCYCGYYYTVLLLHIIQNKMTPVYAAASRGQVGALKALISAGANFNTANVVSKNNYVSFICTILHLEFKSGAKYK